MRQNELLNEETNQDNEKMSERFIENLKGQMLEGVIHEFRNIFSIVTGYTEMALDILKKDIVEENAAETKEDFDEIIKGCKRGRDLLEKVTTMTRSSECYPIYISSETLIKEIVSFSRLFVPKNVSYQIEMQNLNSILFIDTVKFQQLLLSIILNLLRKFVIKCKNKQLTIKVWETKLSEKTKESFVLHLIIMQKRNDVVENFPSAKETINDNSYGFQDHLFLAESLGMKLNYLVTNENRRVIIELPINKNTHNDEKPQYIKPIRGRGQHILVVDDELPVAQVTAKRLEKLGYIAIIETNPKEAVEILKTDSRKIDMLLTDQIMPEMSGLELIEIAQKIRTDIKIVMVTGYASGITPEICSRYGISGLAMKPLAEGELAQLVADQFYQ